MLSRRRLEKNLVTVECLGGPRLVGWLFLLALGQKGYTEPSRVRFGYDTWVEVADPTPQGSPTSSNISRAGYTPELFRLQLQYS